MTPRVCTLLALTTLLLPAAAAAQDERAEVQTTTPPVAEAAEDAATPAEDSEQSATTDDAMVSAPAESSDEMPDDEGGDPPVLTTLVLDLSGRGDVEPDAVRLMNDLLPYEIGRAEGRRVLGMNDIRNLLEAEATKQLLDCGANSCLVELAGAVDADRVIYGSVQRLGSGYFVILSEVDARSVKPVARVQRRLLDPTLEKLALEVPGLVEELMRGAQGKADTGVLIVTADELVEVVVDGRGVGNAPVVVDDAGVGDVDVVLRYQGQSLKVTAPVVPGRATTVNARLNAVIGDVDADGVGGAFTIAVGTGVVGVVGLGAGACCCSTYLCGGFIGGLCGGLFGSPTFPFLGEDRNVGTTVGMAAPIACGTLLSGTSVGAIATAPFLLSPDVDSAHVIEILPPEGEGDPRTLELDPASGEPLSEASRVWRPEQTAAVRY